MILRLDGRDYDLPAGTRVSIQFPALTDAGTGRTVNRGATVELGAGTIVDEIPDAPRRHGLEAIEAHRAAQRARRPPVKVKPGTSPGRGRKLCPAPGCNLVVGNATEVCMCGHQFAGGRAGRNGRHP